MEVPGTQKSRLSTSGSCPSAVTYSQNHLTCELRGPISPKLTLSLKMEDQAVNVSKQQKLVKVLDPEAGTWQCLLSDKDKVLLESKFEGEGGLTPSPCPLSCRTFLRLAETTQSPSPPNPLRCWVMCMVLEHRGDEMRWGVVLDCRCPPVVPTSSQPPKTRKGTHLTKSPSPGSFPNPAMGTLVQVCMHIGHTD